jgi:sugar phosphate isomerase/epimerase
MISYPASCTFISDEVSQDPVAVAAFARRHGFSGVELRSMFGRSFRDLTRADVAEISRILQAHGLRVFGCATPVFKCPLGDTVQTAEHGEIFRRSVEVAVALNAPLLRVFTFLRGARPTDDSELARAASGINGLLEFLPTGMRIGVENEASCLMATGAETERFLQNGADDRLTIVWDPCNVLYVPGYNGAATEAFPRIAPRVSHIHVKDAARTASGLEARKLGDGDTGWPAHLAEIARSGYRGLLSLETHWRVKTLEASALHLPGGFGFSEGGEAASEACVVALREMLQP